MKQEQSEGNETHLSVDLSKSKGHLANVVSTYFSPLIIKRSFVIGEGPLCRGVAVCGRGASH